ncbi:hypothetical protein [Pseudomonas izuensis]|uniref:Uncharacterized protein n=1 Tax=Pseudomonas izuensis TaxID=2684212 RepID=A0ABM7RXS2_9PSED|nr:hypothetical protein [Pseudomonas izuensis]BCX69793.1 hypothetical protein LAB08_R44460 [Pseudomonas izuensis]
MTSKYEALVIDIDEVVEDAIVLLVDGVTVKCFASYCPLDIRVGGRYEVEFEMVLPDGDCVVASQEAGVGVEMVGLGFSCIISGYLDGGTFRSFVDFTDQGLHYEYPQFNEKHVKITVDRLDVSF